MRRALALLGLLLAPAAAWADPISLVAALAPYIGGAAAAAAVTYAGQALLVGLYVYGAARARRKARAAQAKARAEYNASLQDRSVTALQALPTWRIVPGRCITGGDIHAIFTTDKTGYREDGTTYTRPDALKHLVIVFADQEIKAFHEFFLDGVAVGPLDGNGYCTGGEFYSARTDSRIAYLESDGTVTVAQPVVSVLNAYVQTGYGEYYDVTDVSGSISLASGNTVINGPANAIVNYLVQADLGSVRIQQHLGTASQAVDSYLNGILPSKWTSTDRLLGKAYIVLTLDLENQRFQGAPPGITADISGRKVYDPRKDSTVAGGSGSQRNNDASTWAWSDNPALAVRDYITAEWGVAAAQADVNEAYVIAAANACDARSSAAAQSKADTVTASASADTITFAAEQPYTVGDGVRFTSTGTLPGGLSAGTTYYLVRGRDLLNYGLATSVANAYAGTTLDITSAGTGTHTCTFYDYATYKCNGAFNVQDGQREAVLDDLCESMGGNAWEGAQWEVVAAAWTATVMDLGDDDLAGQIEIVQADTPLEQLCNGVRGTFIPAGKSVPVEFDNYSNATFVADDGQEHWDDIALPFVDTRFRARNLCRIRVETGRNGQIIRYPAKLKAWPLQRGDRVRVSSTEYGLSLKTYRVTDWQDAPTAVILTLQEDDSAAYDLADAATSDATPNTGLGSPWVVQAIGTLTCTSGLDTGLQGADGSWRPRVKVSWPAATDPYLADGAGRVVIAWRGPRSLEGLRQEVPSDAITAYLDGVREGDPLVIEAAYRNGVGAYGPPSFAAHTVAITQSAGGYGSLTLVTHGTAGAVAVVGNSVRKIASGGAWNAGVHSKASIAGACRAVTVAGEINRARVLALNSDPTTDAGYAGLDYAIYLRADAVLEIYESGTSAGTFGAYASGDVIEIVYTGPVVTYKRNGTALRTIAVALSLSLSLDSSLYDTGATLTNLGFEALTPKPAQYRLSTYGAGVTSPPADVTGALVNAEAGATVRAGARSYLLARISRTTGLPTFSQVYDVYASSSNAASLVTDLDATDSSSIVVVWGYDEPLANRLTSGLEDALYKHGASRQVFGASDFRYRSAYILIGIGQCGEGQGWEAYRGATDNAADAYLQVGFIVTTAGELIVNGASYTPGAQSLPPGVSGNLLANSSCEFDTDSNGMPDSWAAYNSGTVGTVTYSINSGGVAGSKYLTVSATNLGTGTGDEAGARQIVDLTGLQNQPIAFSTYAQGGGSGAPDMRLYVDYYSAAGGTGTIVGTTYQTWPSLDSAWRRFVHYSRVPSGAVSCRAYCWMEARKSAAGAAAMNFDAVQFEVSTMATGYAPRLEAPGAVGTDQIVPGANTNAPVETSIADDFDDATTAEGPFNTYRTYEDGDGLRAIGSITPFGTSRVNIVVTGAVRIHCGSTSATVADITIKLRNGTTVIDEAFGRFGVVTRYDPVGTGKSVEIPVSLSWQGDLSAATTFNIDVVVTCYQSDGSTVAPFNTGSNGGYVLFNVKSTIVNYKR